MKSAALFVLPTDRMGGAERVLLTLMLAASSSRLYDNIYCVVLTKTCGSELMRIAQDNRISVIYSASRSPIFGLLWLLKFIFRRNFDLVFSTHTMTNAFCSLARKAGLLCTARLAARESTLVFERKFGIKGLIVKRLYKLYGAQDIIICQNDRMLNSFVRHTGPKVGRLAVVARNPIDLGRVRKGLDAGRLSAIATIPPGRMKIAWCGRFIDIKKPLLAIEVLEWLHGNGCEHAHLVMIGDGPLADIVAMKAQSSAARDFITLCGFLQNPTVAMKECGLGLVTSEKEGFPNVILEMLASGISQIVTTDCAGGLDEIPNMSIASDPSVATLGHAIIEIKKMEAKPIDFTDRSAERVFSLIAAIGN